MNRHVNSISSRLSLRAPQRESLEILARVTDLIPLQQEVDLAAALQSIRGEFSTVEEFERDFPSLCFALATGVGKTRLMGAFISYLYQAHGIRHYFVLAPNLTIYNKLIADFTPNIPKYVFQGIAEFAVTPPEIITGDNYDTGRTLFRSLEEDVHVNIFNISKINSEVRGGRSPRIKRLSEYIGQSYFEYLAELPDLVLLMDESHRYRASAGVRAINELKPVLGLELTATPFTETGAGGQQPFKNVIYSYPLSSAIADGFVKEPAVATRENFNPASHTPEQLELLKLEDGVRVHEHTRVELEVYARQNGLPIVTPFMLVVAQDTTHADALMATIQSNSFFDGRYRDRVITVHSNQRGEERDETVERLLSVEKPSDTPTEIVIHVNMLKEGWDVTNLYTIVPLRTASSRTLVEQSIGRGLRLPYGKRTGVSAVDRLTIVAHDRFQEIIDQANNPNSIIRTGVVIGRDIPTDRRETVVIPPVLDTQIAPPATGVTYPVQQPLVFTEPEEQQVARTAMEVVRRYERLPRAADLRTPETMADIVREVGIAYAPVQPTLAGTAPQPDIPQVVAKVVDLFIERSIDIPRIVVLPTGEVTRGFHDFDLDVSGIGMQPVPYEILVHHLQSQTRERLASDNGRSGESRPEDYVVRALIDFDDISYDDHSALIYKLAGQVVAHLRSYLKSEDDVLNVLQYYQGQLASLVHAQMLTHYWERASAYEAHVSRGFTTLRPNSYSAPAGDGIRPFRQPVTERQYIRGMLFGGFQRCLYPVQRFQSDPERRFAVLLEDEADVLKWFKPARGQLQIRYRHDQSYEPDFAVETTTAKFLCEPKRANEMTDPDVLAKARAAVTWCQHATDHELSCGGKPWSYLLIPHDAITASATLAGLAAAYTMT
jgi:type III restriction enzyme